MRSVLADRWGVPVQGGNPQAVRLFDAAVEELVALTGDPLSAIEDAVGLDDGLILGHIFRAYLFLYGTSAGGVAGAARILKQFDGLDQELDEREVLHLRAARAWASGEWVDATRSLERALLHEPRDLLALKVAQDLYFFLGERADLRGVVARVLSAWRPECAGWGYVQGMYAFGLEENARYREAEEFARSALEAKHEDVWAVHALAHVFEMQGRTDEGIAFLTQSAESWDSSFFAVHNWWHLALFHLGQGAAQQAVTLYDGSLRGSRSSEWLDLVDAASLLWRLSLVGVDVRQRAAELASDMEPLLGESVYFFNDWHAAMAFGLAGRLDLLEKVAASVRRSVGSNGRVGEKVGFALLEGFGAFAAGEFDSAVRLLSACLPLARIVGGSNAQRDIIELTLITAAVRSGQADYARDLVADRVAHKPSASKSAERLLLAAAS